MKKSAFRIKEKDSFSRTDAILIIDKKNFIGKKLSLRIQNITQKTENNDKKISKKIVIVSEEIGGESENEFFIPIPKNRNRIPTIPAENYSYIFIVYNGEEDVLASLLEFIKQAEISKGKLIFISPFWLINEQLVKNILECYKNTRVVLLGEVFGSNQLNLIDNFLNQVIKNGRIEILGEGMNNVYPVFIEDVLSLIEEISFSENKERVFFLFQKYPQTALSIAHLIQKIEPMVRVDFLKTNKNLSNVKNDIINKIQGEFVIKHDYPLRRKIEESFVLLKKEFKNKNDSSQNKDSERKNYLKHDSKEGDRYHLVFRPFYIISFLFLLLIFPLLTTIFSSFMGFYQLRSTKNAAEKGDFISTKKSAASSKTFFTLAQKSMSLTLKEAEIIGKKEMLNDFTYKIETGKKGAEAALYVSDALENYIKVFTGKSGHSKDDFIKASNSLKSAITIFQEFRTEKINFAGVDIDYLIQSKGQLSESIELLTSTIDVLPDLLGFNKTQRYLILFQNNMELRPGGGFIGSYGILSVDNGQVKDFKVHDVYDADGQLKGHIEPPYPIRKHLSQAHWYLRDSNFDVDFRKNASMAAFFINEEMGEKVDGVIAVDISFVKELLKALGSVYVSDYKENVNADNLYLLTQTYAEKNFFPGSTQKKDFLRSLFNSLQILFTTNNKLPYLRLTELVVDTVNKKHLLIAVGDPSIQSLFTLNRMSSSLSDNRENGEDVINDFLAISEANLGVDKANYMLKRAINQELKIDNQGSVSAKLTIIYQNLNKIGEWPGGGYKNYLRIVLPNGTDQPVINIDGKQEKLVSAVTDPIVYESKKFKAPTGLELEKYYQDEKTVYGFLVNIPEESVKSLEISYVLPKRILLDPPTFSYSYRFLKQPGTDDDRFNFSLVYPESFKVSGTEDLLNENHKFNITQGKIELSTILDKDLDFLINFAKK